MNSRFLQSLRIQSGEGSRVILMFLYSLSAVGGGVVLARAVSRALFLSLLPETATPYKFILPPLFVVLGAVVYNKLVPRYPLYRLITATNLIMISGLLVIRYFLDSNFSTGFPFLAGLYVYFEVAVTLVGIQFWTFALEIFDPREAKRLFGLIAAGGVFSNTISGIGLRAVSNSVLPKDLIFVVTASLLVGIFCVWTLGKQREKAASLPSSNRIPLQEAESTSTRDDLREIFTNPLLLTLGSLMIITSLVTNIADFQLDLSLQRYFARDGQGMLAYLGTFQISIGIIAVLVQILATNRVLERFGLAAGLLVLPFAVGAGTLGFILSAGAIWAMALPRGADMTLRYTLNDASLNVLFLPIRENLRKRVKSTLDGVVKPPVMALLGLLFLLFLRKDIDQAGVQARDVLPWSYALLALISLWVLLVIRTRNQYKVALVESLKNHRLAFAQSSFDIKDETTVRLISQELVSESSNPFKVIGILEMLKPSEGTDWHPLIVPLLDHASPDVRQLSAQYFEGHAMDVRLDDVTPALLRHFKDGNPKVRSSAIQAFCAVYAEASLEQVTPLLREADVDTRKGAILGLMKYAGISGVIESGAILKGMFESDAEEERGAGAAILGELKVKNYYQPLLDLLNDPNEAVVTHAIQSAGLLGHHALIPKLVEKLTDLRHAHHARLSLAAMGAGIESYLARTLSDSSSVMRQIAVVKVLREIRTETSAKILSVYFRTPNDHVRAAAAQALARLRSRGIDVEIPRRELLSGALWEIKRIYTVHILRADLGMDAGILLDLALKDHLGYILNHLFSILSLLYPDQDINAIYKELTVESGQKANALELIDTLVDREIKETILPLIEAPMDKILQVAMNRFGLERRPAIERLADLSDSADSILRALAISQIGALKAGSVKEIVTKNLLYPNELVQECSASAIAESMHGSDARMLLQQQTESNYPSIRVYAGRLLKELTE